MSVLCAFDLISTPAVSFACDAVRVTSIVDCQMENEHMEMRGSLMDFLFLGSTISEGKGREERERIELLAER